MPDLVDAAAAILRVAELRAEAAAHNVANTATVGYKRQVSFTEELSGRDPGTSRPIEAQFLADFAQGQLVPTGNTLDLAIFGPGLFQLRDGDELSYTRGGTFRLDGDGAIVDANGRHLQAEGGGDIQIGSDEFEILGDGTILERGAPTAQVGLFEASSPAVLKALGGSGFTADPAKMAPAASSAIRAGFVEKSNVVVSDEMIAMMTSVRQAEGGARIVQVYDQMTGQAIATFGRSNR